MSKKGKGLLALIAGVAAGATAIFLSKEENRTKAAKAVKKAKTTVEKAVETAQKKVAVKKAPKK
ncbi:hypothetical protein KKE34_02855 [Patescibacteria group bacterium]|nr:hypothetical protein [Patescibacteria group bacterium]MBU1885529.1 hypothetical protein [Patescibacteria group bacterium]